MVLLTQMKISHALHNADTVLRWGFVMEIADYGSFYEVVPFRRANTNGGGSCRVGSVRLNSRQKGREMNVLVHLLTVLPPVGHVLPPSQVLLAAKSAAGWTPL